MTDVSRLVTTGSHARHSERPHRGTGPHMFFWRVVEVPAMVSLLIWLLMLVLSGAASLTVT